MARAQQEMQQLCGSLLKDCYTVCLHTSASQYSLPQNAVCFVTVGVCVRLYFCVNVCVCMCEMCLCVIRDASHSANVNSPAQTATCLTKKDSFRFWLSFTAHLTLLTCFLGFFSPVCHDVRVLLTRCLKKCKGRGEEGRGEMM